MKIRISRDQFWRTVSNVSFVIMLVALFALLSCSAAQVEKTSAGIAEAAGAAAPLLPPPFGVIASLVAGVAGFVSTQAAARVKGNALAVGATPHPIADFVSSHPWVMPTFTTLVGLANNFGWIHISPTEFGTLAASMGLATAAQVVADNHAESKAPVAATPGTTTTPPASTTPPTSGTP